MIMSTNNDKTAVSSDRTCGLSFRQKESEQQEGSFIAFCVSESSWAHHLQKVLCNNFLFLEFQSLKKTVTCAFSEL